MKDVLILHILASIIVSLIAAFDSFCFYSLFLKMKWAFFYLKLFLIMKNKRFKMI